jgi:hypothetical protein
MHPGVMGRMGKIGSIEQLRLTSQAAKSHRTEWRYVIHRKISIYITWCLLHTGIQANHVTLLSFVFGFLGCATLLLFSGWYVVAGLALFYLYFLFDKVDGEIARYRNERSLQGMCLDYVGHMVIPPLVPLSVAGYLAREFDTPLLWLPGAIAVLLCVVVRCGKDIPIVMTFANYANQRDIFDEANEEHSTASTPRSVIVKKRSLRGFLRSAIDCFSFSGYYWSALMMLMTLQVVYLFDRRTGPVIVVSFLFLCLCQTISALVLVFHLTKNVNDNSVVTLRALDKFRMNHRGDKVTSPGREV